MAVKPAKAERPRQIEMTESPTNMTICLTAPFKSGPAKLALAARLRRETTLSLKAIAALAELGTSKSANARLHEWMRSNPKPKPRKMKPDEEK